MRYDLIVIGGGPGGYRAAERAAEGGLSVLLCERDRLGGVCLNEGCIPSKALLYAAKTVRHAKGGAPFGAVCGEARLDHAAALARKERTVKRLVAGVAAALRARGVVVVNGTARLAGKADGAFVVRTEAGEGYTAKRVLLATGSHPVVPPIPGVRQGLQAGFVIHSRQALALPQPPGRLVVVGGGVVGLELGSYYAAAGSRVAVVEALGRVAPHMDADVSAFVQKECEKQGMRIFTGARVTQVSAGGVAVTEKTGETALLEADAVLLSVGRAPSLAGAGLASVGLCEGAGALACDEHGQTAVPGLYCAGDVNGRSMLAHTAYREAEAAVNHMLGIPDAMDYTAIAACLYTEPEAAGVGETEESAAEKGLDAAVCKLPMNFSGRYMAETERGEGFCKMLADRKSRAVLGVHLAGGPAAELIYAASLMVQLGLPVEQLQKTVFPHPTAGEILREALFAQSARREGR